MSFGLMSLVAGSSFLISLLLMPAIIVFSIKNGFFDDPRGDRLKIHRTPIPYLGGIGMFVGFILPILFYFAKYGYPSEFQGIFMGGVVVIILGLWDDQKKVRPSIRLVGQLLAAGLTLYFGLRIEFFSAYYIAVPLTIFYILGSINAINLFDGLDGLAGGVVAISLIGFGMLFYLHGDINYMILDLSLLASVCGFLPYNFNPARIFMGDNGSTFLGYMLAVLAVRATSEGSQGMILFLAPLLLIGLPVTDTAMAILRRLLRGRPIFEGDRSHIYDRLADSGLSVKKTVFVCCAIQAVFVVCSVYLVVWFKT